MTKIVKIPAKPWQGLVLLSLIGMFSWGSFVPISEAHLERGVVIPQAHPGNVGFVEASRVSYYRPNPPRYGDRPVRPGRPPAPPHRPVVPEEPYHPYPPVRPEEPPYPGWGDRGPGQTRHWVSLGWIGGISRRQWIHFHIGQQYVFEIFLRTRSPFTIHDAYLNLARGGSIRLPTLTGFYSGGREFRFFVDGRHSWLADSMVMEVTPNSFDSWLSELWVGVY